MLNRKTCSVFLVLIFLISFPCLAWAWSGKVVGIADGATITVLRDKEQVKIRLYGIDTPEKGQAFGKKAKQFTSDMVFGQMVDVEEVTTDRYGRTVAIVKINGGYLNKKLLEAGLAWVYTRYCRRKIFMRWVGAEVEARRVRKGLWADSNPIPPWEFRRKKREDEPVS